MWLQDDQGDATAGTECFRMSPLTFSFSSPPRRQALLFGQSVAQLLTYRLLCLFELVMYFVKQGRAGSQI